MTGVFLAVMISLHSANAVCRLETQYGAQAMPVMSAPATMGYFNTLGNAGQACSAACTAAGWPNVGAVGVVANGDVNLFTAAIVQNLQQGICPAIAANAGTIAGATADNCAGIGTGPGFTGVNGLFHIANGGGTVYGGVESRGRFSIATVDPPICNTAGGVANLAQICNCVTTAAPTVTTILDCGCADLGAPTSAPTSIPTTAPTAATSAPTNGSGSITSSDDSLSGGAIAGIVIGSIVGAALIIGAGVMIGSK